MMLAPSRMHTRNLGLASNRLIQIGGIGYIMLHEAGYCLQRHGKIRSLST
jgi:hypothetical protein